MECAPVGKADWRIRRVGGGLELGTIGENIDAEHIRSGSMKYRISLWAAAGFLVAGYWALYVFATSPTPITGIVWTLVRLTCPVVQAGFYFHFGIKLYWVLLANTATYALVGLIVETLRRKSHPEVTV
jgi:hypothetical protein